MNYIASEGQGLFDIAMITGGSAEAAFDLALQNDISLTDNLTPGQVIQYPIESVNDPVVKRYQREGALPATAVRFKASQGIGDMEIELTFIIE